MHTQSVGLFDRIGEGRRLARKMRRLRQLHLDGVDALPGPAVVAGGPAALEAAVDDMRVAGSGGADFLRRRLDRRGAAQPAIGADVEIGQPAFEQERHDRADRMAIVEDGDAVLAVTRSISAANAA